MIEFNEQDKLLHKEFLNDTFAKFGDICRLDIALNQGIYLLDENKNIVNDEPIKVYLYIYDNQPYLVVDNNTLNYGMFNYGKAWCTSVDVKTIINKKYIGDNNL